VRRLLRSTPQPLFATLGGVGGPAYQAPTILYSTFSARRSRWDGSWLKGQGAAQIEGKRRVESFCQKNMACSYLDVISRRNCVRRTGLTRASIRSDSLARSIRSNLPQSLCDAFSTLEKASQSVGSWGCKTSLRSGRLCASGRSASRSPLSTLLSPPSVSGSSGIIGVQPCPLGGRNADFEPRDRAQDVRMRLAETSAPPKPLSRGSAGAQGARPRRHAARHETLRH
jgi:hypothetical protein